MNVSLLGADPTSANPDAGNIVIFKEGQPPDSTYAILGQVFVHRFKTNFIGPSVLDGALLQLLRHEAAKHGAEGLVEVHTDHIPEGLREATWDRWGSALMVTFTGVHSDDTSSRDFMVSVLHVLDESLNLYKHSDYAREVAQYCLAERGYYAQLPDISQPITLSDLEEMDSVQRAQLGGDDAPLLLLVTIERTTESEAVVAKSAETFIRLRLISKSDAEVAWEGEASGSATTGFIARIFEDESKMALGPALAQVFSMVPRYRGWQATSP